MPNIATVLKEEIRRLARKEAKVQVAELKKASARQRRDIAALKRELAQQQRASAKLAKSVASGSAAASAVSASTPSRRFSAKGLAKHRAKLGISAADYARLVGVSPLTIYAWEKGRSRPRQAQLEALGAVRGLGVREVLERIGGRTPRGRKAASRKP
jgi:DNA-binding transcriptional regulator YiaG